ncbi:MAG: hypothetical protein KME17_09275 [Cyanosarcina radialis HA8281-LM2]|jgi:hypothetical protein|nr:hypothetical protein [Cyanosarcina radialis HA8281-LM2]
MKHLFEPLRSQPGEFRVALCLSQLGESAFEVLKLAESLGFDSPKSIGDSAGEVWAIVLQQFHGYEADPRVVVDPWDERLSEMWQACEPDAELKLLISHNFEAYHLNAV